MGVESKCELLDFSLDGIQLPDEEVCARLNEVLVSGIHISKVYQDGKKLRDLTYLHSMVYLEYDNNIPTDAIEGIKKLFAASELIVPKKSKNGIQDQDLIPMIKELTVKAAGEDTIVLDVIGCCQNPTLNPLQLAAAINLHLPEYAPDFAKCCRIEILDNKMNVFR